jgi:hypothetical protein
MFSLQEHLEVAFLSPAHDPDSALIGESVKVSARKALGGHRQDIDLVLRKLQVSFSQCLFKQLLPLLQGGQLHFYLQVEPA